MRPPTIHYKPVMQLYTIEFWVHLPLESVISIEHWHWTFTYKLAKYESDHDCNSSERKKTVIEMKETRCEPNSMLNLVACIDSPNWIVKHWIAVDKII